MMGSIAQQKKEKKDRLLPRLAAFPDPPSRSQKQTPRPEEVEREGGDGHLEVSGENSHPPPPLPT